jgi:hypothetical protein
MGRRNHAGTPWGDSQQGSRLHVPQGVDPCHLFHYPCRWPASVACQVVGSKLVPVTQGLGAPLWSPMLSAKPDLALTKPRG